MKGGGKRSLSMVVTVMVAGVVCFSVRGEQMRGEGKEKGLVMSGFVFEPTSKLPSSHGSTIYLMPDGTIMCAWYAGSAEGDRDVAVYASRLADGNWTDPVIIADTEDRSEGNPVLWADAGGKSWLFFVTIHGFGWNWARIKYRTSDNAGETWGPVRMFREKRGWMTRNHPITLGDGTILLPLYSENKWCSEFMASTDQGKTWEHRAEVCSRPGNIQAAVVELDDGSLYATMRTGARKGKGRVWETRSHDHGRTWTDPVETDLPNPNAGADMIKLPSGNLLLAYNDSDLRRTPLSLAVSEDGGGSWRKARDVEDGEGEYSYPSLCLGKDGVIHLSYTYRRQTIKHVAFTEEWLK